MKKIIRTIAITFIFSSNLYASDSVDKAIDFLKTACVTKGSSFEVTASLDGSIKVKNLLNSGIKGSVTLSKKELEGFADAASKLSAEQATEMRTCMKPHIDKILSILLTGSVNSAPKTIKIDTSGAYFVTNEFDTLLLALSDYPNEWWSIKKAKSFGVNLHSAKIKSYFVIAEKNGLGEFMISNDSTSSFQLTDKGVNYVLNRNLIQ